MIDPIVARLSVAALGGLAVGLEREWSGHATGPLARFAGLRTFLMLGALGGVAGWLSASGATALGVVLVAGAAVLVAVAYVAAARPGGAAIEGTTEVAALVVLALGVLAGYGFLEVASGATAVMVLALSEKERLRHAVARIGDTELRAALQFAVLALVVLPLLPDGTYGPLGGIRPRALWIVVLIFSGLNFAGYVARRAVGAERGFGVTGALGGLISSTAVTFQFARLSRQDASSATGLAVGTVSASTVLLPRVLLLSAVLNPEVARGLVPYFAGPFLLGAAMAWFALVRKWEPAGSVATDEEFRSPLRLGSAIRMTLVFQAVLMALDFARSALGSTGVIASAALLGLTDMDALTLSMNRLGSTRDSVALAARAIAVGVLSNALLKLGVTLVLGSRAYQRRASTGLLLLAAASALSIWLFW